MGLYYVHPQVFVPVASLKHVTDNLPITTETDSFLQAYVAKICRLKGYRWVIEK